MVDWKPFSRQIARGLHKPNSFASFARVQRVGNALESADLGSPNKSPVQLEKLP